MKFLLSILLLISIVCLPHLLEATVHTFTDLKGRKVTGEVLNITDSSVSLRIKSGKVYEIPLSKLSAEDIEWSKQMKTTMEAERSVLKADSKIEVFVKKEKRQKLIDERNYGGDDYRQTFQPAVVIKNNDKSDFYKGNDVLLVMLGESVKEKGAFKVLSRQEFSFEVAARQKFEWRGDGFTVKYDEDDSNGYIFGHKYSGFIIIIKNSKGEIAYSKATRKYWLANPDKAYGLRVGQEYRKPDFH